MLRLFTLYLQTEEKPSRAAQLQEAAQRNARHIVWIGDALSEHATQQMSCAAGFARFDRDH